MRVWKYEKFIEGLDECIEKVEKAIDDGMLLTDMELFDLYFKQSLSGYGYRYLKGISDKVYRTAYYCAEMFDRLQDLRKDGYTNAFATDYVKEICREASMRRISVRSYKIDAYDTNGVLYFDLICSGEVAHTFEVTGVRELTETALILIAFLSASGTKDLELKNFLEKYVFNVFSDVMKCKKPTPYVYNGKAKTLKSYINRDRLANEPAGKIIKFKVG